MHQMKNGLRVVGWLVGLSLLGSSATVTARAKVTGWSSQDGQIAGGPDAASWGQGSIHVVARGNDDGVLYRYYDATGQWSAWSSIGGNIKGDPATVSTGPGELDVFARGHDDALWHRAFRNGGW